MPGQWLAALRVISGICYEFIIAFVLCTTLCHCLLLFIVTFKHTTIYKGLV